jgi:hypothetical protein
MDRIGVMPQTVEQAITAASFYTDEETYALIKLPVGAVIAAAGIIAEMNAPFSMLMLDKDELTLLVIKDAISDFEKRLRDFHASAVDYRLITIDVELEPQLVGFLARISDALAEVEVSILTYAAYSRDHIFVPIDKFDTALKTLKQLQKNIK